MKKSERVRAVLDRLDQMYTVDVKCYLDHEDAWQLLVATILSAQCTDARVNTLTPALFARYPDPAAMAGADIEELERIIHPVGFYHMKAKNLIACCRRLCEDFGGEVPRTVEELTSLPGVGRKTANVIRGNVFGDPSVVVDTHVGRISRRLGFTKEQDPEKVEYDLMKVLPKENWIRYNIQIIMLGREICRSQRPRCGECFLSDLCPARGKETR